MQEIQSLSSQLPQPELQKKSSSQQFQLLSQLGRGSYGEVYLARKKQNLYALKRIQKIQLLKQKNQHQAFIQKQLLRKLNHPGILKLIKCYQDKKYLNFVLEFCQGGNFLKFIRDNFYCFTEELRVFYVAQIVSILEYLHSVGITHRDLKPENMILSKDGHLKLIDFGTAEISNCTILDQKFKINIENIKKNANQKYQTLRQDDQHENEEENGRRKSTFIGTYYYLSPEILELNSCGTPSDLWALGCIIYQIYYLQPPFKGSYEYQIFEKIKNVQVSFPASDSITEDAADLIKKLLVKNPDDRLGSNSKLGFSFKDLKNHSYFKNIDFSTIFTQKVPQMMGYPINQEEQKFNKIKKSLKNYCQQSQQIKKF